MDIIACISGVQQEFDDYNFFKRWNHTGLLQKHISFLNLKAHDRYVLKDLYIAKNGYIYLKKMNVISTLGKTLGLLS